MKTISENEQIPPTELARTDKPESELAGILREDEDPEVAVARMEKIAELAPRWRQAMRTILMTFTFPEDWEEFGEGDKAKVCLSSAGAERVAQQFKIKFFDVIDKTEEWEDEYGKAIRFIYTGKALLGEKIVVAQGNYSTRDAFLGKAGGEWKNASDINLGDIRNAAYHRFIGNAIKALLGLRALPVDEYKSLMAGTGQDAKKTGGHTYGTGTKGGTDAGDITKQQRLAELCLQIANAGAEIQFDGKDGALKIVDLDAEDTRDSAAIADENCKKASGFMGNEQINGKNTGKKKWVPGKLAKELAGQRLDITLAKVNKLIEEHNKSVED